MEHLQWTVPVSHNVSDKLVGCVFFIVSMCVYMRASDCEFQWYKRKNHKKDLAVQSPSEDAPDIIPLP
ncbi:hypothetical protein STEG23_036147 [Scotinomys teguina]